MNPANEQEPHAGAFRVRLSFNLVSSTARAQLAARNTRLKHTATRQKGGHREEGAVTFGHHDAATWRHRGAARAQVGHGIGEGVDQAVKVEE